MAETTSSLFLIEKLMKLVSMSTLYGGPRAALYLKNRFDGIWSLHSANRALVGAPRAVGSKR